MWKFHGTMLSLKYAMSVFQKRSKLVGCVQSARVNDVINFGQIISGDYYLRLLLDEGGSTKIVKAYATYNTSSMHPLLNITFSLSLSFPLTPVLSSSMISTTGSCCPQSPTWRPCVSRPWLLSTASAMRRLDPSMTLSSLLGKWHWYVPVYRVDLG